MIVKEKYYTKSNIESLSFDTIKLLEPAKAEFNTLNSALLVLDMQNFFLDERSHAFLPSAETIIQNINDLIDAFESKRLPVIYTRHANTAENANLMNKRWRDILEIDSPLSEIDCRIQKAKYSDTIVKSQYDAFYNTELENLLISKKIDNLVLCGVMTHICVETTARSAFMRGFENFVVVDGVATYNYDLHLSALKTISHCSSNPILSINIIDKIKHA